MSYTRTNWGADERVDTLVSNSRVRPIIIVGIWNTKLRFNEYMPDECITPEGLKEVQGYLSGQSLLSKEYLRFIVEELKPFIDTAYSTLPGRDATFIMGSNEQ